MRPQRRRTGTDLLAFFATTDAFVSAYVHEPGNDRSELVRILDSALSHRDRSSFERHVSDLMRQCRTTEDVREGARLEAATRMLEYEYGRLYDGAAVTVVASGERHRAR